MRLRGGLLLSLAMCGLATWITPALAGKPSPPPVAPLSSPLQPPVTAGSTACPMGISALAFYVFGYIIPPDDAYHTLLDPAGCATCGNGYRAINAHVLLRFSEPCEIPVRVSLTPAVDDDGDGCYTPDPLAPPLCPPVQYLISAPVGTVTGEDYTLPLAASCCFTGKVFLTITFDQGTCVSGRPEFVGPAECQNCIQYNTYPGAPHADDLCAMLSSNGLYGVDMWVDTECCLPTPVRPGSWGRAKTLYR